jgi:hypothetical protein
MAWRITLMLVAVLIYVRISGRHRSNPGRLVEKPEPEECGSRYGNSVTRAKTSHVREKTAARQNESGAPF